MDELSAAIRDGERALRGVLRDAQEGRANLTGIMHRTGATIAPEVLAKLHENYRTLERVETYVALAIGTLPDGPDERSVAVLEHLGSVAAMVHARRRMH